MRLFYIQENDDFTPFPNPNLALDDPNGLLAMGANLSPRRLLMAYRQGIFPWFSEDEPILWWSPNPRAILWPEKLKISRSLKKSMKKNNWLIIMDTSFAKVMQACSKPRLHQEGTWITLEMKQAYYQLHKLGYAHSVEVWQEGVLIGGLYGVALGQVFFGESMFSFKTDASKTALVALVSYLQQNNYKLIDIQQDTDHLRSLGSETVSRTKFLEYLNNYIEDLSSNKHWQFSISSLDLALCF